jgi:hypothetical protein
MKLILPFIFICFIVALGVRIEQFFKPPTPKFRYHIQLITNEKLAL